MSHTRAQNKKDWDLLPEPGAVSQARCTVSVPTLLHWHQVSGQRMCCGERAVPRVLRRLELRRTTQRRGTSRVNGARVDHVPCV